MCKISGGRLMNVFGVSVDVLIIEKKQKNSQNIKV